MTTRRHTLGRTLISRRTPRDKTSNIGGIRPTQDTFTVGAGEFGTALLLTSILCAAVAFVLTAFLDGSLAVPVLAIAGVLFYAGHWIVR